MRYWLPQIILLAGILMFLDRLPELSSNGHALLATTLAAATIWTACSIVDVIAQPAAEVVDRLRRELDA